MPIYHGQGDPGRGVTGGSEGAWSYAGEDWASETSRSLPLSAKSTALGSGHPLRLGDERNFDDGLNSTAWEGLAEEQVVLPYSIYDEVDPLVGFAIFVLTEVVPTCFGVPFAYSRRR